MRGKRYTLLSLHRNSGALPKGLLQHLSLCRLVTADSPGMDQSQDENEISSHHGDPGGDADRRAGVGLPGKA